MANNNNVRYKKVQLDLGGRKLTLDFNFNAICAIEEIYSSFQEAVEDLQRGKIRAVRMMVWAGLIDEKDVNGNPLFPTQEDFGRSVDLGNIEDIIKAVMGAVAVDLPQEDESKN